MAGLIMPNPKFIGFDNNGDPLSGGKLYTYAAGTSTPQDTYSNSALTIANTNPVILDSGGRATVFLSNSSYKFVLKDADDVTIWTQDNITTFNPTDLDIEGTVGEAVSEGQIVYLSNGSGGKTAGKWYKSDSDFDYASSVPQIALVTVAASADASASLRLQGSWTFSSAITAGQTYYVGPTAGTLATTAGTYSRFFGVGSVDGFTIVFAPNPPNAAISSTFTTLTATQAFILGTPSPSGVRLDLESGAMAVREGDDSAYAPIKTGDLTVSGTTTLLTPMADSNLAAISTAGKVLNTATTATDANSASAIVARDASGNFSAGTITASLSGNATTATTASSATQLQNSRTLWGQSFNGTANVTGDLSSVGDIYLSANKKLDWGTGDVTITNSANGLAFAGASSGYTFDALVSPASNDGAPLGSGTVAFADLFLASGGVINWNNGDVTVTHSADALAFAGASSGYTFDAVISPAANDGAALGTGLLSFSDVFLALGAVINFDNGDVTVTHSANLLAFAGASSGYTFDAVVKPAANDGAALGVSGTAFSDLFLASGGVINWDAGDVTITHSANTLSFGGASSGYKFDALISPATNDGAALGTGTVSFSDLFLAAGGVINFANGDVTVTAGTNALVFAGASSHYQFINGGILNQKQVTTETTPGTMIGLTEGQIFSTTGGSAILLCNRQNDDGSLVDFRQANTSEGTISVSGTTVSYNTFAGSHWSQMADGSRPSILRGTVLEAIDQMCVWPGEQNDTLPCIKVSDTVASAKVYGVFLDWDNDWTATNDLYCLALGAFICRIHPSVTVQLGDLLESNGDGTARVQADTVVRSSTIGKVTNTTHVLTHPDGSYCVPTTICCG